MGLFDFQIRSIIAFHMIICILAIMSVDLAVALILILVGLYQFPILQGSSDFRVLFLTSLVILVFWILKVLEQNLVNSDELVLTVALVIGYFGKFRKYTEYRKTRIDQTWRMVWISSATFVFVDILLAGFDSPSFVALFLLIGCGEMEFEDLDSVRISLSIFIGVCLFPVSFSGNIIWDRDFLGFGQTSWSIIFLSITFGWLFFSIITRREEGSVES